MTFLLCKQNLKFFFLAINSNNKELLKKVSAFYNRKNY